MSADQEALKRANVSLLECGHYQPQQPQVVATLTPTELCSRCGRSSRVLDMRFASGRAPMSEHQLDGTKRPAALLHVETDVDVVLDALARWHREQATDAHPGGFDLCPASPCRDVREAL